MEPDSAYEWLCDRDAPTTVPTTLVVPPGMTPAALRSVLDGLFAGDLGLEWVELRAEAQRIGVTSRAALRRLAAHHPRGDLSDGGQIGDGDGATLPDPFSPRFEPLRFRCPVDGCRAEKVLLIYREEAANCPVPGHGLMEYLG